MERAMVTVMAITSTADMMIIVTKQEGHHTITTMTATIIMTVIMAMITIITSP
jgi:hypothetical protein